MYNKIVILLITLAIIFSPQASAEHYTNDLQQNAQVVINDTAPIDSETKPDTENKEAVITFTKKTDNASEKTTLNKKEKKQTIRGLFTLGGFNKNEKNK